jgi:hypothetical protein
MNRASGAPRRVILAQARIGVVAGVSSVAIGLMGGAGPAAADTCPNAAVRAQQGATALPDCRAYELVNAPGIDEGEVNRAPAISDDGDQVAYMSVIPGDDALGGAVVSTTVARRSAGGWSRTDANINSPAPVYANASGATALAFSPDFTRELSITNVPADPRDQSGGLDAYRVDVGLGTSTWLTAAADAPPSNLLGATADLDRLIFRLAPGASVPGIYASSADGNSMELLSRLPDGTPAPSDQPAGGAYRRGLGVGEQRTQDPWVEHRGDHAVSDDTRRLYFYNNESLTGGLPLYLRDGDTTIPVSASQRAGDVGTMHVGAFISATHDGAAAYFASPDQLTDDATPGGGIYRFVVATRTLTQITPDAGDPSGLNLAGAIASDDQSHLYFTSTAALGGGAVAGDENAYVWTAAGDVRFIAAVGAGDKFVRVSRDGRYAVMLSSASIGGAPNGGHKAVYEYDFAVDRMACASCRPDGSPSAGDANLDAQSFGFPVGGDPDSGGITHGRAITDDGRVIFASKDQIVVGDQTTAADVYIYDKGTVSMLTTGRGDVDSFVADNSDDGRNVFVVTRAALVGADRDAREFDVYDVRVDGGFLEPPAPGDPCRGDDCQPAAPPSPPAPQPPSARVAAPRLDAAAKVTRKLALSRLTAAQRSTLARTGKVTVTANVTGGGTVSLRGRGRIAGKVKTLGSVRAMVFKEARSTVKLSFKLSSVARRELSRRHRLSLTLEARLTGVAKAVTTTAALTRKGASR